MPVQREAAREYMRFDRDTNRLQVAPKRGAQCFLVAHILPKQMLDGIARETDADRLSINRCGHLDDRSGKTRTPV